MKLLTSIIVLLFTITGFTMPSTVSCSFGEINSDGEGTFALKADEHGYYTSTLFLPAKDKLYGTSNIISFSGENEKTLTFSGNPYSVKLIEINKHTGETLLHGVFGAYIPYPNGDINAFCEVKY